MGDLKPAVVITGGSEGIGFAIARRFARAGHELLLIARNQAKLDAAAVALREMTGRTPYTASIDLTAENAADEVEQALTRHGLYAEILVNNAGIGIGGAFTENDHEKLKRLINLNICALTLLMHRFLPGMIARRKGGVINIASLGGFLPGPYQAAYYASKAYVISLTKAVAHELWGTGVHVCAVTPGAVSTKFHERMGAQSANYLKFPGLASPEQVAWLTYLGYRLGRTVIIPGLLPTLGALWIWILPHFVLTPFIGWLLKKRY